MSDCRACWICGRSVLGVRIYDAVPEFCRPVDIWHGSRTLRYGLWRSWGRSAWSTGWSDSFIVFFLSFSCLPMHLCVCLSLPQVFWSMLAHLADLRQETGPTHNVAYQKENSLKETCRMKCQAVSFKQRGCSMQIFNSPALQVDHEIVKGEVRRKMNFTYVLGFVVLRDVVKIFLVSSSSFARKTTGRNRARSHSGAWRGLKTKWDLKLSLLSPTYLIRYLLSKSEQQLPSSGSTLSSSDSSGAWISSHFRIQVRSADEYVAPGRRQPERVAVVPTGVSPLQKRIWKWDFYHCSSCNFFFHICFCHLWCELPL